jgi:benzoate membrane transport protein
MHVTVLSSAFVATLVGFAGTLALVVAAAQAVGATPAQTVSWITAISAIKALESGWLSWRYRMPIITAWSTAGAALIGASTGVTIDAAVGAFLLSALLVMATALVGPLGRAVERIPMPVASGMLAGILLPFVLAAFKAIPVAPLLTLAMVATYALVRPLSPLFAVVAVLVVGIVLAFVLGLVDLPALAFTAPTLVLVAPRFDLGVLLGLGVPLYLVTMASQNLPGFAVLRASGYQPPVAAALLVTGGGSAVSALFGAHTTNLAAITAALCTGPDVHPDPAQRWRAGLAYMAFWMLLAILGASCVALLAVLPPQLVAVIVGLALLGALLGSLGGAMHDESLRYPALLTFAVTASGVSFFGIGAAFWGLVAGLGALGIDALVRRVRGR